MTLQATALAASIGALFLLASPAAAQTPPGGGQGMAMAPARTLAEVPAFAGRLFDRLDANQDAAITGDELAVLSSGPAAAMGGGRLRRSGVGHGAPSRS